MVVDQLVRLTRRERLERQRLGLGPRAPRRAEVDQVGARKAEQEDRCVVRPPGQVLQQVEQGRLSPVDVFEENDERPVPGKLLEQAAYGPEQLTAGRCRRR